MWKAVCRHRWRRVEVDGEAHVAVERHVLHVAVGGDERRLGGAGSGRKR